MPRFDLTPEELAGYAPDVRRPADLEDFWRATLAEARAHDSPPIYTPAQTPVRAFEVFDVRYPGYGGEPIAGWLLLPMGLTGPAPTVVLYQGYGGGRGLPHEWLPWAAAGYATFVADVRGQGFGGTAGATDDPHGGGPAVPGVMTKGIESPDTYYYRRVYTDAVRAVDAVRAHPSVDPARVVVAGGSQGGGIALAVSGLADGLAAALIDVPFLCHFERSVGLTGAEPYEEIARYLAIHRDRVDRVFETLSYIDGVNLARGATAPALFSVGLLDTVCPPSSVYAAFHAYGGPKELAVYPFNGHEGGAAPHWLRQTAFLSGAV